MNALARYQPYAPRRIACDGVRKHGEWRIKRYSVVHGCGGPVDDAFAGGEAMALNALPDGLGPGRPLCGQGIGASMSKPV